jgi:hypothetical protein
MPRSMPSSSVSSRTPRPSASRSAASAGSVFADPPERITRLDPKLALQPLTGSIAYDEHRFVIRPARR